MSLPQTSPPGLAARLPDRLGALRTAGMSRPAPPRRARPLRWYVLAITAVAMLPVLALAIAHCIVESAEIAQTQDATRAMSARSRALAVGQDLETIDLIMTTLAATADQDGFDRRIRVTENALDAAIALRPAGAAEPTRSSADQVRLALALDPESQAVQLSVPVRRAGQATEALVLDLPQSRLEPLLNGMMLDPPGAALLVDPAGRVAATSGDARSWLGQSFALRRHAEDPNESWMAAWGSGVERRVADASLPQAPGWRIMVGQDAARLQWDQDLMRYEELAAGIAVIALGMTMALLLSRILSRPLLALTEHARAAALGSGPPSETAAMSGIAEFEALRLGMIRADAALRRRVAAEREALREARTGQELLDSVVNATAESIYVKDLDLRYALVNRAALQSGPEPRAEWQVLGRSSADLFPTAVARRIEAADRSVLATGRMIRFELDVAWPDQPVRWIAMTITPWLDADDRVVGVVAVSHDITEPRAAALRLRAMQADLLRATRLSAMGAMASGLAHELNQPLAAATNYLNASARLLDHGLAGVPEDAARARTDLRSARGAVTEAVQQMLRSGAIVRRLRDFVERGEAELHPQDVSELIRGTIELARADGITQGIDLRMVLAPYSAFVLIDLTQFQQVLLNLIRNAAEAITEARLAAPSRPPGVIVVAAAVRPPEGIGIDVIDNGPGLSTEIAARLFQPFISTKPTGMGIGLSICHTIIQGHGGQIEAQPARGGGMRFRITLPPVSQPGEA